MKFYRYMSFEEFHDMGLGITIKGHSFPTKRTTSSGVCFLGEKTRVESCNDGRKIVADFSALDCYSFMSGVVSSDVLVEFNVEAGIMTESEGVYADPFTYDWDDTIEIVEYCIPSYDKETVVPIRYCVDVDHYGDIKNPVWYDYH